MYFNKDIIKLLSQVITLLPEENSREKKIIKKAILEIKIGIYGKNVGKVYSEIASNEFLYIQTRLSFIEWLDLITCIELKLVDFKNESPVIKGISGTTIMHGIIVKNKQGFVNYNNKIKMFHLSIDGYSVYFCLPHIEVKDKSIFSTKEYLSELKKTMQLLQIA